MTFLQQIESILDDIRDQLKLLVNKIRSNKAYAIIATLIVSGVTFYLVGRFDENGSMMGSIISLSTGLALNFLYSVYKEINASKEKIHDLDRKASRLEEFKTQENDDTVKTLVNGIYQKQLL